MNKGLAPTPFADDTWLTDWVGFDPVRHNGIHSPVRNADGSIREWQNATTLGCVRLDAEAAVTVFEFASIGMRVEVHD
jgi:lipoprotein-anchoring transpeptidase ErfK/SrfK